MATSFWGIFVTLTLYQMTNFLERSKSKVFAEDSDVYSFISLVVVKQPGIVTAVLFFLSEILIGTV